MNKMESTDGKKTVNIRIIRHSERLDYTHPFYWLFCFGQFWADSPLTSKGYDAAKEKALILKQDGFSPKYIFTSPYKRTTATAGEIKQVFSAAEILIEPLLAEYQPYYAHTIDMFPNGIPTTYLGTDTGFAYPEDYDKFLDRIKYIVFKLIEDYNEDMILVTHGEVLKIFVHFLQKFNPELMLDVSSTPYLMTLGFSFDLDQKKIIKSSIRLV